MSRSRSPEMSIPNKRRFRKVGTGIDNEPIYEPFSDSEEESIQIESSQEGREKKNEKKEKPKTEKKAVTAKPAERKNGKKAFRVSIFVFGPAKYQECIRILRASHI